MKREAVRLVGAPLFFLSALLMNTDNLRFFAVAWYTRTYILVAEEVKLAAPDDMDRSFKFVKEDLLDLPRLVDRLRESEEPVSRYMKQEFKLELASF